MEDSYDKGYSMERICSRKTDETVKKIYPDGMHSVIADFLRCDDIEVKIATLDDEKSGLSETVLKKTDVLIWWGHMKHGAVPDNIAERVQNEVLKGMGFIALHSAHHSKPFKRLMGTACNLSWREHGDLERIWKVNPSHPITKGIGRYFELEHEETYAEPFSIPEPMETLLVGWYEGGEVIRAGCTYKRQNGKIFYFQPGHESFPTFFNKDVQQIIKNAVYWAAPDYREEELFCPNIKKVTRLMSKTKNR